jgi:hypothetical protein
LHNNRGKDRTDQEKIEQDIRNRITAAAKINIDKIAYKAYGYIRPTGNRNPSVKNEIDMHPAHIQEVPPVYIQEMAENHKNEEDNTEKVDKIEMFPAENHADENAIIENGENDMDNIENIDKNENETNDDHENENDDEKDKKECVRKFKEAFNDIDDCYICSEQKGSINSFAMFPCHYHSLSHSACLIFWVKKYPRCPHCKQYTKFYIDNEGNEHDIRGFCGKFPFTSEEEEAREEIVRNKRANKEARERADEKINRDTLDHNQQVERNKAGVQAQQCKERDGRHQVNSDRKSISINNNQHKGMDIDIEIEEEVDPAHKELVRESEPLQSIINIMSSSITDNQQHSSLNNSDDTFNDDIEHDDRCDNNDTIGDDIEHISGRDNNRNDIEMFDKQTESDFC